MEDAETLRPRRLQQHSSPRAELCQTSRFDYGRESSQGAHLCWWSRSLRPQSSALAPSRCCHSPLSYPLVSQRTPFGVQGCKLCRCSANANIGRAHSLLLSLTSTCFRIACVRRVVLDPEPSKLSVKDARLGVWMSAFAGRRCVGRLAVRCILLARRTLRSSQGVSRSRRPTARAFSHRPSLQLVRCSSRFAPCLIICCLNTYKDSVH